MASERFYLEPLQGHQDAQSEAEKLLDDMGFLHNCIDTPFWSEDDKKMVGKRINGKRGDADLQITIGNDYYETKHDNSKKLWTYELVKNGDTILEIYPSFTTHDPNINFWNIDLKS